MPPSCAWRRRAAAHGNDNGNGNGEDEAAETVAEDEEAVAEVTLEPERFAELQAREEILLTVTNGGFGKRSSAFEYRVTGRGGQGIANILLGARNGTAVVTTFPVREGDDIMLVTDAGRLIRVPGDQVRLTGRAAQGVMLLRLNKAERVTSVFPVLEAGEANGEEGPEPEPADPDA